MVDRYDPVVLDEGRAREAALLRVGVDGVWKVAPVNEIIAYGVSPVLPGVIRRIALVEQVPATLPETEAVGVVQRVFGVDVVVHRPMWVAFLRFSRRDHPLKKRVFRELRLLLGEGFRKGVVGNERGVIRTAHGISFRLVGRGVINNFSKKGVTSGKCTVAVMWGRTNVTFFAVVNEDSDAYRSINSRRG